MRSTSSSVANGMTLQPELHTRPAAHGADLDDLLHAEVVRGHAGVNAVGQQLIVRRMAYCCFSFSSPGLFANVRPKLDGWPKPATFLLRGSSGLARYRVLQCSQR